MNKKKYKSTRTRTQAVPATRLGSAYEFASCALSKAFAQHATVARTLSTSAKAPPRAVTFWCSPDCPLAGQTACRTLL